MLKIIRTTGLGDFAKLKNAIGDSHTLRGYVLQISSDEDDHRIFLGLTFSILENVRNFWVAGFFRGIQNNLKIGGAVCVSRPESSANKVQFFASGKFVMLGNMAWDFWGLIFGPWVFWSFDFCLHLIIPVAKIRTSPWALTTSKI